MYLLKLLANVWCLRNISVKYFLVFVPFCKDKYGRFLLLCLISSLIKTRSCFLFTMTLEVKREWNERAMDGGGDEE